MEIRKILDILEASARFKKPVRALDEEPVAAFGKTYTPPGAAETPAPVANALGVQAQANVPGAAALTGGTPTPAPTPAPVANALGVQAQANVPGAAALTGGTPKPAANIDTAATAARDSVAAQTKSAAAPTAKTYGGGYDPSKVQYASGSNPAAAPAAARPDVEAQKKGLFAPQAAQPVNNQSSGMTAQSQAQNTKAASAQATAPTSSGYTAQSQAQKSSPAAPTASPGAAAAMASKSAPTTAPAQTSDQIATAALNAPDQGTSGASLGVRGAFNTMAEEELEEELKEFEELAEMMRLSGLLLNEKAVSKQQQKFMGMVHAMQKGQKVKGASPELKKVAKTMSKKDAEDFAQTKHKGLPKKVTEGIMLDEGGNALNHIVNRFKYEVKNFMNTGDMADNLFDALYDYYLDTGEMPYGIAKAREGDPYAWVEERFYSDMGSEMSESVPVREVASDDTLQRLAELAGLEEDGPGYFGISNRIGRDALSPHLQSIGKQQSMQTFPKPDKSMEPLSQFADELGMASLPFFTKKEKSDYDVLKNRRAEREFQQSGSALTDKAGTIYDRAGNPKDMPGIRVDDLLDPKPNRDRDLYRMQQDQAVKNMQKEDIELNQMRRIAGLAEADGNPYKGVPSEKGITKPSQPDFKKSTTPAPAPSKPEFSKTTPSAAERPKQQPDKTAPGGDTPSQQKEKSPFDRSTDELTECGDMEMDHDDSMDQESVFSVNTNMTSDGKKDITVTGRGDGINELLQMLKMAGMRPHDDHDHMGMSEPEVIMVSSDSHHAMHDDDMMDEAKKTRTTKYSNTPDEEYQTVASITRQGNDLNREKKQFASKPRLGDNPMAEDILNADLDAMLESILLRDDDYGPAELRFTPKSFDPKTGADWSGYNITAPRTGRVGAKIEPGKEIEYYAADPLPSDDVTGATIKNYGKDVEWHRGNKVKATDDETEVYEKMDDIDEQGGGQPNPYPVGQDALTPQQKLNPTNNPNKSIVRGIKDFIMNPLKPGM